MVFVVGSFWYFCFLGSWLAQNKKWQELSVSIFVCSKKKNLRTCGSVCFFFRCLTVPFPSTRRATSNLGIGCCCATKFLNCQCGNWDHEKCETDVHREAHKLNVCLEASCCKARNDFHGLLAEIYGLLVAINVGFVSECSPSSKKNRVQQHFAESIRLNGNKRNAKWRSSDRDSSARLCGFHASFHKIENTPSNNLWEWYPTVAQSNLKEHLLA